jgi:hypothetical protein
MQIEEIFIAGHDRHQEWIAYCENQRLTLAEH